MGGITRRTLLETQDIKESQVTHSKVLDHTLGSQDIDTTVGIIVAGTQIKDDLITEAHVLDHTLGSHNLGTTVAIIVEGTQIKDDLITEAHVLDHTLGSHNLGTTVAIIVEGTQIKDDLIGSEHIEAAGISYADQIKDGIIGTAKIVELQELGTIAAVTKTGVYLIFDSAFGAAPTLVATPLVDTLGGGTHLYIASLAAGSAELKLTGMGTVVAHYQAKGVRA